MKYRVRCEVCRAVMYHMIRDGEGLPRLAYVVGAPMNPPIDMKIGMKSARVCSRRCAMQFLDENEMKFGGYPLDLRGAEEMGE